MLIGLITMWYLPRFLLGAFVFSMALIQAVFLDRAVGAWLAGAAVPPTSLDSMVVSIPMFITSVSAVVAFVVWIAKDRISVEIRLNALAEKDKAIATAIESLTNNHERITQTQEKLAQAFEEMSNRQMNHDRANREQAEMLQRLISELEETNKQRRRN